MVYDLLYWNMGRLMRRALLIYIAAVLMCPSAEAKPAVSKKGLVYEASMRNGDQADKVIFGHGTKSGQFKKSVRMERWNGEASIEIAAPDALVDDDTAEVIGDELVVKDAKRGMYFKTFDDETFKFGLLLYEKPLVNSWTFNMAGHESFDFFFQPALANKNEDGSTWENSEWGGKRTRPADVNNSYAVYHKTKRDHVIGQTNYATGKFCHIYRPKFIDANGATAWGDINIENGQYTVSCPQSFLDSAVYPIKANDTVGYTTLGGSDDSGNVDLFYSWEANSNPSSSGTLTSMTMAYWHSGGTAKSKYALYSDDTGVSPNEPLNLITNSGTAEFTITRTTKPTSDLGTWTTANTGAASIVSGTKYWLATNNNDGSVNNAYDSGATAEVIAGSSLYSVFPPDPTTASFQASLKLSFYYTYTPSRRRRGNLVGMG